MALSKAWPKSSLKLLVFVIMFSGAPGITWIEPSDPVILPRGNLEVNCSTDCDQPQNIGLETQLDKTQVNNGTRWRVFLLKNITQDTRLHCFANCNGSQMVHTTSVTVILLGTPRLTAPKLLEVGKNETVSCETDELFQVDEAQIHLSLGGKSLSPTVTQSQDMLRATAFAEGEREGQWKLTCNVILRNQNQEDEKNLTVYSFPLSNLVIIQSSVPEGTLVNVTCEARAGTKVWINETGWSTGEIARLSLKATEKYDRSWITCHAVLELLGEKLWRNSSEQLLLQYGPQLEEANCPGNWTWPEGSKQIPNCNASGNPVPTVTCVRMRDQMRLPLGVPLRVTKAHAGPYNCTATNQKGRVNKRVTVTVESLTDRGTVAMGVLLVLGLLAFLAGTIITVNRRKSLRRGSYSPQMLPLKDHGAHKVTGDGP